MKNLKEFEKELFLRFEKRITDEIFLFIQKDKELMKAYLDILTNQGNLGYVNSTLAQSIAKRYGLVNTGVENNAPKSNLIQSFSELKQEE